MAYLGMSDPDKVEAATAVAAQIWETVVTLKRQFDSGLYLHRPYPKMSEEEYQDRRDRIARLLSLNKFDAAASAAEDLYDLALEGVTYYQRYHRLGLYFAVSATFVGFILWTAVGVVQAHSAAFVASAASPSASAAVTAATAIGGIPVYH